MLDIDRSRESRRLLIYAITIFFAVVLVFPIITLFKEAFYINNEFVGISNFKTYFSTPSLFNSFNNSLYVSSITSVIVVSLSFIFAYAVERCNIKFKRLINFIALLPLFIPTMTHAIALIYLLGENGLISTGFFGKLPWLAFDFPLYGKWGVIIAECIYVFPAIYMMFSVAFRVCDYRLYEAAEVLDTSKSRMFFTITLPSVKYTIISAFFSAFTMVFSDFGIPKVLGGSYSLLATDIYKQVIGQSNITMGATVGILLIIPSIISFVVDRKVGKSVTSIDSSAKDYVIKGNKIRDRIISAFVFLVCTFIVVIFLSVIMAAFVEQWPYNLNITTKWFNVSTVGTTPIKIFANTLFVSLISAILGTIIAILAAYITQRGIGFERLRKFIDWISITPLAIPGLVIGLSYLLFFNKPMNPMKFIYGTFIIMIFANIVHFFSMPYMTIKGSMKKIDKEYENVSETMGVPWYKVFDNVVLPLSKASIIESFQYYFLNSMMTISALVFLYTTKTKVASVEMVATYDEGMTASTAAIAVMILASNLVVKYGIELYKNKSENGKLHREMNIYRTIQIVNDQDNISKKILKEKLGVSLLKANLLIKECIKNELICKIQMGEVTYYEVTEKGFELLRQNIELIKEDRLLISKDSNKKTKMAVILAAGKRIDFDVSPAGLAIGNTTLIKESIRKLRKNGIEKIIIVLGYGKEIIMDSLKDEKDIIYVVNDNYNTTASMESLALASKYIKEDFILIEGDLFFEDKALKELLDSEKRDCILLTKRSKSGDEEFVQLKNNYLFKLGKDIHQFNRVDGELVGIIKVSYNLLDLMMKEYKENMNSLLNYEYILLDVSRNFKVSCLKIEDLIWGEIDNITQYERVKKIFNK